MGQGRRRLGCSSKELDDADCIRWGIDFSINSVLASKMKSQENRVQLSGKRVVRGKAPINMMRHCTIIEAFPT